MKGSNQMKIVSVCSSPRKHGNTEAIIRSIGQGIKKSGSPEVKNKYFSIADMDIAPCRACSKCLKKGRCVISDDFEKISSTLIKSDLIILGSPVFFSDVNAQAKAFIDRTYALWHKKVLKGKKVILVASCAESGAGHTIDTLRHWARDHEMNIIASIDGISGKKGEVLRSEITMRAINDAVHDCTTAMISSG